MRSEAKAKPDYLDTLNSLRVLFMKHWHPLSCMNIQKETSLNFYILEREGRIGGGSLILPDHQFLFTSKKATEIFQDILNAQDGHSALHWKWDSIKLSQLQHPKMETLKSQVTFTSLANFLE